MLVKQLTSFSFLMGQGIAVDGQEDSNFYRRMLLRSNDCPDNKHWLSENNYMSHDKINEMNNIHFT